MVFFLQYKTESNIPFDALLSFHRSKGKLVTVSAVRPLARFGGITLDGPIVTNFKEEAQSDEGWINGGFFVMEPEIFDYLNIFPFHLILNTVKCNYIMEIQYGIDIMFSQVFWTFLAML